MTSAALYWHTNSLFTDGAIGHFADDARDSEGHAGGAVVVDLLGRVAGLVVVRVPERRGVGDHQRRVTRLPERPMVRPSDTRDVLRHRGAFGGETRVRAERADA